MTHYGDDRARSRHTPSAGRQIQSRDLTDSERDEHMDADRDEADRALLYGWAWCAGCDAWTLGSSCGFCGCRTFSEKPSRQASASTSGVDANREITTKERAA